MAEGKQFTTAEIAAAVELTPQAVRKKLRDVPSFGVRIVRGIETATWLLPKLPADLQRELNDAAKHGRYRSTEAALNSPAKRWQSEIPIDKIRDKDIEYARKLREALRRSLLDRHKFHWHDSTSTAAEKAMAGIEDYRRQFKNTVSPAYWQMLLNRVIKRDNGAEDWNRLEIYLPEKPRAKRLPVPDAGEEPVHDFARVESYIAACRNPHAPDKTECRAVWTLALEQCVSLVNAGRPEKQVTRQAREFLFRHAPFLAASREALWIAFSRRYDAFKKANGDPKTLRDGREENGQHYALPENDRDFLIHRAVFYYRGDIAPAWRDCLKSGFSPAVVERYAGKAYKKSHVPRSIIDSIAPEVELLTIMDRGPRAFDAIKGYVTRSYDGISSLQCISGDDFTLNTYFYIPDGNGWYQLTRGQVILFIDFRSLRILGWALEPRKSYSSLTIRSLCTHVFAEYGVPEILYFERGLWKSATLLKGKSDPLDMTAISHGLKEFGIKFIHAIRPRTKTVERIGGMFQDIAEAEPGYCGRDERRDAPESLRRQMSEVETRKVHPEKYFYSLDQWNRRIQQLVDLYNADPQQGHILAGMSPDQAFEAHIDPDNPPVQFSAGLRYLLANDKRLEYVTANGVTIQIGKQKFNYRGEQIAHLIGREVLTWFDPENTDTIVLTDPDRKNPVCVERSQNPNALENVIEPDAGILSRELRRVNGQVSFMKTRYNVVKAKFPLPRRQLLVDAQTHDLGREIEAQKTELTTTATRRRRQNNLAQRLERETGIAVPENNREKIRSEDVQFLSEFLNEKEGE